MNKKQMVLAALLVAAGANLSQAQQFYPVLQKYTPADKERMEKNFVYSLSFTNDGIVESALALVTMMKLDLPADEFPRIMEKIDNLVVYGTTPVIRYKAYLAEAVFANPSMFKEEAAHRYSDPDTFFSALAGRITKTLLSYR
jgi:hypothetical protein